MSYTTYTRPLTDDAARYTCQLVPGHKLWYALQDYPDDYDWGDCTDSPTLAHNRAIERTAENGWCRIVVIDDDGANQVAIAEHIYQQS